jgi:peroxiredoxin
MFASPLALAALSLLAAPELETGTQLTYSGTMAGVKDDGDPAIKKFTLTLVRLGGEGDAHELLWTLDETGRGGWMWLDRFGRCTVAANPSPPTSLPQGERGDESGPALLYERAEGQSVVPLIAPVFAGMKALEKGAAWSEERLDYQVSGEATKSGQACWEIDVRSPYGHKRTLWVAKDSPLVVALRETVFIGQGEEHKLVLELTETSQLPAEEMGKLTGALDTWNDLRKALAWQPRTRRDELNSQQLATLKAELPKIAESAAIGPLATIAAAAQRDATGQRNRAGAVAALRDKIVGQSLTDLKLTDVGGKPITAEDLKGQVVVLHFWHYRDTPLEEPYGQVGYLDFLLRRRGESGVKVIGISLVEGQQGEEPMPRAAAASARKLKSFMNLSYPICLDDGSLLARVGDPRVAAGKLPLFVVIGKDGKVAEYHAGLYDVKANEGLAELDAVVAKLLK